MNLKVFLGPATGAGLGGATDNRHIPMNLRVFLGVLFLVLLLLICFSQANLVHAAPNQVTPDQVAPNQVTPNQVTPNQVTPDQVAPDQVAPDEQWLATIVDSYGLPQKLVVVDKTAQQLSLYQKQSPLRLQNSFTCTTGQVAGDKQISGDLRTPEGVYFVVNKIDKGLDYLRYGTMAHTLNYPNPIDKLRGKTGHGIWIHSRGRPITPMETEGCIAVDLGDIDILDQQMSKGMAVVVASNVVTDASSAASLTKTDASIAKILERKTKEWNSVWASRSSKMFDFYDAAAYSKAQGESFAAFKSQKERLFTSLPWIQIVYGTVQVLQGPDYWVSWFNQYYRAPNLSTEGVRRLYWQPDAKGELRIVGMEWIPDDLGMETAYLENVTPSVTRFIERWRKAWVSGNVNSYGSFYAENASQGQRAGQAAIKRHKNETWLRKKPAKIDLTGLRVMVTQDGIKVDMTQIYRDASGYQDKGIKTIVLHPKGDSWIIVSEDWSSTS